MPKSVYIFIFQALAGCFLSRVSQGEHKTSVYLSVYNTSRGVLVCVYLCLIVIVSVCGCHRQVGGGRHALEIDNNSCDRNEESSVLKGLASRPERSAFPSLIREQSSWLVAANKQVNTFITKPPENTHYCKHGEMCLCHTNIRWLAEV